MSRIILASASQRRQMLLEQACIPFEVISSNVDEAASTEETPNALVSSLASAKANTVSKLIDGSAIIIGADTIITYHGKIIGKPEDENSAFEMLNFLQGKKHSVYTGMTVIFKEEDKIEQVDIIDSTDVYMRKLSEKEIWAYIKTKEPFDKAGGYAIQEKGSLLIEKIDGDYYTVVGLPLVRLYLILQKHGIDLTKYWS